MIVKSVTRFYRGKCFLVMFSICFFSPFLCRAEDSPVVSIVTAPVEKLELIERKSTIIETSIPVKRISLADEEIADALVLTPQQIYLTGKVAGITRLTLWDETDKVIVFFDLEVSPGISRLKEKLHEMFPDEEDIRITAIHKSISLSGTVSSTLILSQVLSLAQAYASEAKFQINNFLQVSGVQQVMLEVRVAEMSRSTIKRLGINFTYLTPSGKFGVSRLDNLASVPPGVSPIDALGASNQVNMIFRFLSNDTSWTFFIDAIKDEGLIKILAEPTLITLSGKTAHFLAGGEFPVPIPQSGGGGLNSTITIEYKPFGVGLNFTPTVLSSGRISMEISPEVSELDFRNAVSFQGFIIPGITTRRVSTVVELADGQSFAIAGLLNDNFVENVRKYPFIGEIPIIGNLFKTSVFEKRERELIVIVTPHLVRPYDKAKQTLPTDQYVEPNDIEFYLFGRLEGIKLSSSSASNSLGQKNKGGLEGKFGHLAP